MYVKRMLLAFVPSFHECDMVLFINDSLSMFCQLLADGIIIRENETKWYFHRKRLICTNDLETRRRKCEFNICTVIYYVLMFIK